MKVCEEYCGIACIDGSCPIARSEEYAERGYDVTHSCNECIYYEGCTDCIWAETEYCKKEEDKAVSDR